jgi:hypothetical protein
MTMFKTFILPTALVLTSFVHAQKGVKLHKDERIQALIQQRGAIVPPATSPQIVGYRVQLAFDSNKKVIDEARLKFLNNYPKIDTYVIFNSPHFLLKVGDFRTKEEAEKVREAVMRDHPTSFVIKESINLPRVD